MQQNSMINNYSGRPDSYPAEEERQYTSKKAEGQWRWERDAQQMSPQLYSDGQGQGGNAGRSFYPNQMPDIKMGSNQEQRAHSQEQNMEVGYEDSQAPQTLERLEQKFHNDIMKFMKEQDDAEDVETARHREKIIEINNQYQEKLSSLRAKHATLREEFLRREAQARLQTYQHAGMTPYPNNSGSSDMNQGRHVPHGYGAPDMPPGEPHRQFGGGGGGVEFDSYRERHESFGRGRMQGADTRVPPPGGRVYNTGPRYY